MVQEGDYLVVLEKLRGRKRQLIWGGLATLLIVSIGVFLFQQYTRDDFSEALRCYNKWKANPNDAETYKKFKAAYLSSHHAKKMLSAELAQLLLNQGNVEESVSISEEKLNELRAIAPAHAEYARISLLIVGKKYQEALERSVSLKEQLTAPSALSYQNALRVACLQHMVGNEAGEFSSWNELEHILTEETNPALKAAFSAWDKADVTFKSFVNHKKSVLPSP